ncbi:MAG: DEAD/DEAH box helicase [Parabacteroides sp.]|nr:DEAD/DEAH box helicase [Parabacteroides sp.]
MAQKFGFTWWGAEWLKSLDHIDYANRIPRGAAYARKGAVESVELNGNLISAKVAGSRPKPYSVKIAVPTFTQKEINLLMNQLMKYPGIISNLLKRELDPEILTIAKKCGLQIFPQQWDDLKMNCSCPDWAVPCKHLAATIYMFSREIDNNPFIVFEMHGIDLLGELQKRGIAINDMQQEVQVPEIKEQIRFLSPKELPNAKPPFRKIDYSRVPDSMEPLLILFPENPSFSPDFKEHYTNGLRKIRKKVLAFFSGKSAINDLFPNSVLSSSVPRTDTDLSVSFNESWEWSVRNISYGTPDLDAPCFNEENLPAALLRINPDFLPDYRPSVIALHQTLLFALHLAAKGMVAPQIVRLSGGDYLVRWIPAYADPRIQVLVAELEQLIPGNLLTALPRGRKLEKPVALPVDWLISFFLGKLFYNLSGSHAKSPLFIPFFFKSLHYPFNEVGEKEIPGNIKAWTTLYSFNETDYRPVFSIDENKKEGFDLHIGIEDKREKGKPAISLQEILTSECYENERFQIIHSLNLISSMVKEIGPYIHSGASAPIHYTNRSFVPFLLQIIPTIRILDAKVFMPKALQNLIRPKASISLKRNSGSEKGFLCLSDLFTFDWEVALGDVSIPMQEFMKLQKNADELLKFKQSYIYTDAETLDKLRKSFEQMDKLSPTQLLQAALTEEYEGAPIQMSDEIRQLIDELRKENAVPLPKQLNATLRPYQERGFAWMYRNMRIGFGSILADDMGLGKTLQSITLILKLKEEGKLQDKQILIIVPTGLLINWQSEISRFAPSLTLFVYHGSNRDLKQFGHDILLTTYGILRSDNAKLKKKAWAAMFIDEAQNIKNYDTAQSKAARSIPADVHIALSGTPVENRLTEFWSIMEFANKGYLDTLKTFKEKYATPIQYFNDISSAEHFRKITAPFMMRRMKSDKSIIDDLPDKIEQNDYTALKSEQAALYSQTLEVAMKEIEEMDTTNHESLFKRQGLILQMILALKQICNHPAQFLKNGDFRSELSGKAEMLLDRIESIVDNREKVLVFTQFKEMGNILARFVEERTGNRPMFYHGGCSVKERQMMVDRFQNNPSDKVFILSLKAAGTGLNLTAATHVIHYDLWWNPAVEAQATDRAYRIGQHRKVVVHRFITKDTFEERIDEMIRSKKHLADMTVANGESWIGKLSNTELREIFE